MTGCKETADWPILADNAADDLSDDEDDDDDDEDQDAMEADLDKDEIVRADPGRPQGDQLLITQYTISNDKKNRVRVSIYSTSFSIITRTNVVLYHKFLCIHHIWTSLQKHLDLVHFST